MEHLIELPATLPGVPTTWTVVSTNKSKKVVRYHPPEVVEAAAAAARTRARTPRGGVWGGGVGQRDDCAAGGRLRAAVRAAAGGSWLAALARQDGYCRPTLLPDDDDAPATIRIRDGRHPILDATLAGGKSFVPNSVELRADGTRALVVTGPNMGGKSCFIRQTALACVMAQCGSFVPAASAQLTVLDGVYTRMGAADNLAMGASTFLEEMSECSASLLVPFAGGARRDARGGTSTHDGVAVAHATLDHLVGAARCLALFVTHYPSVAREMRACTRNTALGRRSPTTCERTLRSDGRRRKRRETRGNTQTQTRTSTPWVGKLSFWETRPGRGAPILRAQRRALAGLPRSLKRRDARKRARWNPSDGESVGDARGEGARRARESGGGEDAREGGVMRAAGRRKIGGHRRATRRVSENLAEG